MKLLVYCPFLARGRGGLERVGTELANALCARGHEVVLGFNGSGDESPRFAVVDGVETLPWDRPYVELREVIESVRPDVYFVFNGGHRLMEFWAASLGTGVPFAYQESTNPRRLCRDNWAALRRIPLGQAAWERELVASAAVRIRQTMPSYAASLPAYVRPQVRFFPNAVAPARRRANLSDQGEKTLLNIGGLKKVKQILPLLEAFRVLALEFPEWRIKSFGGGFDSERDYQESVLACVRDAGLEDRVLFLGETDAIYDEYAAAKIHVIPSRDEGRPTCVCEAMSHGLPSVGFSSCPGTNELIKHDVNGLLLDHEALGPEGLARELGRLMADAQERRRLGDQAYEDSRAFLPEVVYGQWERFFAEAASYAGDPGRLLREQRAVDPERADHAARMRGEYLAVQAGGGGVDS